MLHFRLVVPIPAFRSHPVPVFREFCLWLVLLIITTTWLLGDTTFLQPNEGGHVLYRPTPIQLTTMLMGM